MISGVEAVEVGGSGGAAGIGPGGSCRLRWACWLRFPSLARVVLPGIPVPFQLAPGVEVVEAVEVSADPAAGGCVSAGWLLAPAPSNGVGPSSWRGLRHYCGPGQPPAAAALAATSTAGKEDRTGAIVSAVEVLAVRPGILVPGPDSGRGGGGGRWLRCVLASGGSCRLRLRLRLGVSACWLAPAPSHPAGAASDTIAARPASGGSCAGCDLNGGERGPYRGYRVGGGGVGRPSWNPRSWAGFRAWRRWRSVAALCVGLRRILSAAAAAAAGRVGLLAGSGSLPSSWRGLRHYCGPASLRRQLRWLRPQRRGKRTVQGLSCRRWRCWPSALESSFLARFRAWRWWRSAAGWLPAPSDTIAAPASLRRQLRWLRPQRQL